MTLRETLRGKPRLCIDCDERPAYRRRKRCLRCLAIHHALLARFRVTPHDPTPRLARQNKAALELLRATGRDYG